MKGQIITHTYICVEIILKYAPICLNHIYPLATQNKVSVVTTGAGNTDLRLQETETPGRVSHSAPGPGVQLQTFLSYMTQTVPPQAIAWAQYENEEASGNPEGSKHSKVIEEPCDVTKLEIHFFTGEWVDAPEDSRNFASLFKPIYEGVQRIINFQEGIPTGVEKKGRVTPFLVTCKMKSGMRTDFSNNPEKWPKGIRNIKMSLTATLK